MGGSLAFSLSPWITIKNSSGLLVGVVIIPVVVAVVGLQFIVVVVVVAIVVLD